MDAVECGAKGADAHRGTRPFSSKNSAALTRPPPKVPSVWPIAAVGEECRSCRARSGSRAASGRVADLDDAFVRAWPRRFLKTEDASLAELLCQPDEKSFRPADVAEPIGVFVLDDFAADQPRTMIRQPGERVVDVVDGKHHS